MPTDLLEKILSILTHVFSQGFLDRLIEQLSTLPFWVWFLVALVVLVNITGIKKFSRHKHNIKKANKALSTLRNIPCPRKQFTYLRKVNPFVFEEMVLTALSNAGHKIERNKRYTGDGGIDGKATLKGRLTLIQSKRYTGHISRQHVEDFDRLCQQKGYDGLFVHTGKTGKQCYQAASGINIISGNKLLALLTGAK